MADQRQRIIASVFSRRNASGNLEETYVSHVKIWEDAGPEGGGRKPRYILLSQASNGSGFLHKSKLNTNGSFSVGKTWRLPELRAIQVVNPLSFNITLSRTYRWQTENQLDQANFLDAVIQLFRLVAPGSALQLEGFQESQKSSDSRAAQSSLWPFTPSIVDRGSDFTPSPTTQTLLRTGSISRAPSPTTTSRFVAYPTNNPRDSPTTRPPSLSIPPQLSGSRTKLLRPSNADNGLPIINPLTSRIHEKPPQNADSTSVISSPYQTSHRPRSLSPASVRTRTQLLQNQKNSLSTTAEPVLRRDQNARISFYDLANQATLDRLISEGTGMSVDPEGEDENTSATMATVEDMIEGYEWASDDVITRKSSRGAADLIEARLLDELMALEKANIHSFLEFDDRISIVLKYLDEAVSELDNMDSLVSSYKIHLNTVSDDIFYIQSQNRGLQVQTQNQRALLAELENLLQTVNVDQGSLVLLTQESLEKPQSIERLEEAAAQLYKALQAGRDTDMAATMERLQEYRTHNAQFCKRMFDFLSIMFTAQSTLLLGDTSGMNPASGHNKPTLVSHGELEAYLGRYSGLVLYLKEMDENVYAKLCAAYFSVASGLHSTQFKTLFSTYTSFVKKSPGSHDHSFSSTPTTGASKGATGMRRAGTIMRSPIEGRNRDKDKVTDGDSRASEVFRLVLEQLAPAIYRENEFITDFLQINEAGLTFADYMGLDNYFRRQAARAASLSQPTLKLVRGSMDLIFGFLPAELKIWLDSVLEKDKLEIIGIIVHLERFLVAAQDRGNQFFVAMLEKQHVRLKGIFERYVKGQITDIEQTKLSSKKRQGVAHFVKQFPTYVGLVENQLVGADVLEIRANVNAAYEKIVQSIFDSLKQMAKMDGEGEDKGQLNYHVILIENMHHFVAETSILEAGSVNAFCRQAESIYDENLSAYIKIVIRRPFSRIIDYFEGVEHLLKTTAPTEVVSNNIYNKNALRKIVREYNSKDLRKHVDALFLRVGKHFAEASGKATSEESGGIVPGTVLVGVWKACEEELLRITDLFKKRIAQCYSDTGINLEYTTADVEAAFRRHRIGS
ncbi:Exocyst complex component 1 [Termitomyces sp. T112]|nr:Exocyst complex component 1 [Termitomyces sp. T112]